jgi:putative methyltransferase (TIGR04325 family)
MRIYDFIPPVIIKAFRKVRPRQRTFSSFAAAMYECGDGYDSARLAEVVVQKTECSRHTNAHVNDPASSRIALALGLLYCESSPLNVLDVGGAAGAHYFAARKLFPSLTFRWHVVETPSMVAASRRNEADGLQFFENGDEAAKALRAMGGISLAFSSGTLPCVPEPRTFLRWLTNQRARTLALVRVGLHEGISDITNIQVSQLSENGPGPLPIGVEDASVSYPFTICSRQEVERILHEKYETVLRTEEPGSYMHPEARTFGYFCRCRS